MNLKPNIVFKQTLLSTLCTAYLMTHVSMAYADTTETHTVRYLDPSIWNIVVNENECFKVAPNSLMTVEPIGAPGARTYNVTQYFDRDIQRALYAKPLEQQIAERKIVAGEFCHGIASISDMKLPMTKGQDISDANDGVLLVDKVRQNVVDVMKQLNKMTSLAVQASNGIYSSAELQNVNIKFQAHIFAIQQIVNNARFNGIMLLDGSQECVDVPVDQGLNHIYVGLSNLSSGSLGLNIAHLIISDNNSAQNSLDQLHKTITWLDTAFYQMKSEKIQLNAAVQRDATTTYVDERTDEFTVQKKGPKITEGGHA